MQMICPVGQRATAVITPIKTLYDKKQEIFNDGCRFTLLHTGSPDGPIKQARDKCEQWILKNIHNAKVDSPRLFPENAQEVTSLVNSSGPLYFNTNGGMHWQIAFLSLFLPGATICIASDDRQLYRWPLLADIGDAESFDLMDLGLETYLSLDDQIVVKKKHGKQNQYLSDKVNRELSKIKQTYQWTVSLKQDRESRWENVLNEHIIMIHERYGSLALLLDLCDSHDQIKEDKIKSHERYRILNALVGMIRYKMVIVTDNPTIKKRAITDGIEVIAPNEIGSWRDKGPEKTKDIMPDNAFASLLNYPFKTSQHEDITQAASPVIHWPLDVCLGDNPAPTLRLALTGRYSPIRLWYDGKSRRIKYLASLFKKILAEEYPSIAIDLKETDHRGKGIVNAGDNMDGEINITPGTKMQAIALCAAARKICRVNHVSSIDKNAIRYLNPETTEKTGVPLLSELPMKTLLRIQIPPFSDQQDSLLGQDLWAWIMKNLANGLLSLGKIDLFNLKLNNKNAFVRTKEKNTIQRRSDGKIFEVPEDALAKDGGFWWEYVVAQALRNQLKKVQVFTQVKWSWMYRTDPGIFMSELDVVFTKDGGVWAVSCKTSKETKNILPLKSEAERRLGRMVHCCLAVPHNDMENSGESINGVLILTPVILNDGEKLRRAMDTFSEGKRTTLRG